MDQLPRDGSGIVVGLWRLRHRSATFSADIGPLSFHEGVSLEPLGGLVLDRVMASLGGDVEAFQDPDQPAAAPVQAAPAAQAPAQGAWAQPTAAADLTAMSEPALRALAAKLGLTDPRMRIQRVRRWVAEELGVEGVS